VTHNYSQYAHDYSQYANKKSCNLQLAGLYSQVQHNGLHGIHEIRRGSGRETDEVEEVHRPPGAAGDALHERLGFALANLMLERALHGRLDVPPSDVALPLGHELESLDVVRHVPWRTRGAS